MSNMEAGPSHQYAPQSSGDEQLRWLANSHPEVLEQLRPQTPNIPPPPYSVGEANSTFSSQLRSPFDTSNFQTTTTNGIPTTERNVLSTSYEMGVSERANHTPTAFELPLEGARSRAAVLHQSSEKEESQQNQSDSPQPRIQQQSLSFTRGDQNQSSCYETSNDNTSSISTTPFSSNEDAEILSKSLSFISSIPPPPFQPSHLTNPILIPQTLSRTTPSTFIPAYASELTNFNIPPSSFLQFIQNLNIVGTANAPLQALNMVGGVVGMVPELAAQLVGAGLQAGSQVGSAVVSKVRVGRFVKEVNGRVLAGRGLRVRVVKCEEVVMKLGISTENWVVELIGGEGVEGKEEDLLDRVLWNVQMRGAARLIHGEALNGVRGRDFRGKGELNWMDRLGKIQMEREQKKAAKKDRAKQEREVEKEVKRERSRERKEERKARREEKRERSRERKVRRQEKTNRSKERKKEKKNERREKKYGSSDSESESDTEDTQTPRANSTLSERSKEDKQKVKEKKKEKEGKKERKEEKAVRKMMWILIENI